MSANGDLADEYARQVANLRSELDIARETLEEAAERHERAMAAEHERRTLVNQALRQHIGNMTAELRRYENEVDHINAVCDDRTPPHVNIERSP